MIAVGVRDFRARLSYYVRLARQGEVIQITSRGVPIAEMHGLKPLPEASGKPINSGATS